LQSKWLSPIVSWKVPCRVALQRCFDNSNPVQNEDLSPPTPFVFIVISKNSHEPLVYVILNLSAQARISSLSGKQVQQGIAQNLFIVLTARGPPVAQLDRSNGTSNPYGFRVSTPRAGRICPKSQASHAFFWTIFPKILVTKEGRAFSGMRGW